MAVETTPFDVTDYLDTAEAIAIFLEPQPGDTPEDRAHALATAERAARRWGIEWLLGGG